MVGGFHFLIFAIIQPSGDIWNSKKLLILSDSCHCWHITSLVALWTPNCWLILNCKNFIYLSKYKKLPKLDSKKTILQTQTFLSTHKAERFQVLSRSFSVSSPKVQRVSVPEKTKSENQTLVCWGISMISTVNTSTIIEPFEEPFKDPFFRIHVESLKNESVQKNKNTSHSH